MAKTSCYLNNFCHFILLAVLCHATKPANHDWSYNKAHGNSPSNWYKNYPTCRGKHQSPVNIVKVHPNQNLSPLCLDGYDIPFTDATLVNNGHSAQVESNYAAATLNGGCLDSKYKFAQFHFHWGKENHMGSEHLIHGRPYSMEGHFVHINVKYGTLEEAKKHADGIAVLAVFYQVVGHPNPRLKHLIKAVEKADHAKIGHTVKVEKGLVMKSLLPDDTSFYCYRHGSLTTPSCDEAVVWTILRKPVYIGQHQINAFRKLKFPDRLPMVNNFRPVQPIGSRTIFWYESKRHK